MENEQPFSLRVNTHIVRNNFSASVSVEELAKAGILPKFISVQLLAGPFLKLKSWLQDSKVIMKLGFM